MARLERWLSELEVQHEIQRKDAEHAIKDEVVRRFSDEELRDYIASLRHLLERGEPFELKEEDEPIWLR